MPAHNWSLCQKGKLKVVNKNFESAKKRLAANSMSKLAVFQEMEKRFKWLHTVLVDKHFFKIYIG